MLNPKRSLQSLLRQNYAVTKAYSQLRWRWKMRSHFPPNNPLIIYQMGKVGSTTIVESLRRSVPERAIFHVHFLSPEGIAIDDNFYRSHLSRIGAIHDHLLESWYLREQLDKQTQAEKYQVVTLVREPIARNISAFFQTLEYQFGYDIRARSRNLESDDFVRELSELFFQEDERHERPLTWFDLELKEVFGVDVFSTEFDRDRGYQIYHSPKAEVLVLKLESLEKCAQSAFQDFLGLNEFTLAKSNVGEGKKYKTLYRRFLHLVEIPEDYIDRMYDSRYTRYFYSDEEIKALRDKWKLK
ncbi:MAG: putative capsular polysaccharide synthesis family protein [Cyanobacteriota bacterium]|nr:putative capsular polysaccharide synthesis family protein [Cyanobacteriota bacterium]